MTVNEMQSGVLIGGNYVIRGLSPDFAIFVVVRDLRTVYGSVQAEVEPVAGSGLAWVSASRLRPVDAR